MKEHEEELKALIEENPELLQNLTDFERKILEKIGIPG